MKTFNNILLARDFSPSSSPALRHAVTIARENDATLRVLYANVLHADPFGETYVGERSDEQIRMKLREETEHALRFEKLDTDGVEITYHVERDVAPGPAILTFAEESATDLIVIGTHGRRGLRRMLLGSVAEEVVRLATSPVLTVPAHTETQLPFKSILVPVDFSEHSRETLRAARDLARRHDAKLTLLHVVEDHLPPSFYTGSVFSAQREETKLVEKARKELAQLASDVGGGEGLEHDFRAESGHAADRIAEFVEANDVDLVMMATHGRTGLTRFALGSVAEKVLRTVRCPMLTRKAFPEVARERRQQEMEAAAGQE